MIPYMGSGFLRLRVFKSAVVLLACLWLSADPARAGDKSFTNYLAQAELADEHGDVLSALKFYSAADQQVTTNCGDLCLLARRYCDLMYDTDSADTQKKLAGHALASSLRAVQADPKNATAHLCVAVSYAKNFPYLDNGTKN